MPEPELYAWTVRDPRGLMGAVGVSRDRLRAVTAMHDALGDTPAGSRGVVHEVELDPTRFASFLYGAPVAYGQRPATFDGVVMTPRPPREERQRLQAPPGGWECIDLGSPHSSR